MTKKWELTTGLVILCLILTSVVVAGETLENMLMSKDESGNVIRKSQHRTVNDLKVPFYREDHIIVRFRDNASENDMALSHMKLNASMLRHFKIVKNLHLVKLPPGMSVQKAIGLYRKNRNVLYAEPDYVVHAFATPNDPLFNSQWSLQNTGLYGGTPDADIDATNAWDIHKGSRAVVAAVIDTGVDYNHPDLSVNMWRNTPDCNGNGIDDDGNGYIDDCFGVDTMNNDSDPMDDHNHGSHVSGIIGAKGNNSVGVVGVNWNVSIMACKFLDANGSGSVAGAIECFEYIESMKAKGVNIVATNNSWGSGYFSQALFDAIDVHRQKGILCIAAAGNESSDNDTRPSYPAGYYLSNVISVASTDRFDNLSYFSNMGKRTVHLGAPGSEIWSTILGNTYEQFSGTSMATPHVTGAAALLKAQNTGRGWKAIKNLILSSGDTLSSLNNTITQKRLNLYNSLTCANSVVLSRLLPANDTINGAIGEPIDLSVLHINCATANGEVSVTINPGGQLVTLKDNGISPDQVASDGIYSGQWTPASGGTFTLIFPGSDIVTVNIDPDLEPGFPVKTFHSAGSYHAGQAIHTLVGNIDDTQTLEIVVTGLANGPLYAWHSDGTPVEGWPIENTLCVSYPAMGNLSGKYPGFEVFSAYLGCPKDLVAFSGSADILAGWPRQSENYVGTPPALADIDGDGLDEIFVEEEDEGLHAYRADGSILTGWPAYGGWFTNQERHTPAIADLDGDGDLEIVTVSGANSDGIYLFAYHHDGRIVNGFPVLFNSGFVDTFPVIGDVDGDGQPEIVVVVRGGPEISYKPIVHIMSGHGEIKHTMYATGEVYYGTAPALADLDNDSMPEIIVQTNTALDVWKGNGSTSSGWPVVFEYYQALGNSSPVVGDVDGDQLPDVVITTAAEEVRVYNRNGVLHPHFPKELKIGSGAVPAIADIDLDGRNEIIVSGDYWDGYSGFYDKVWVYDLGGPPHGKVEWGQFGGSPEHQGCYGCVPLSVTIPLRPLNPIAKPTSSSKIALAWKDNSTNETGFKIERKPGACDSASDWNQLATKGAEVTTYTNTGLTANTSYSYRVRAYNGAGNSAYSNCTSAKTAVEGSPDSPSNLKAFSVSSSKINLSWKDNSDDETVFKVYRKVDTGLWALLTTTPANAVSYSDTTASGNTSSTTYSYYVKACKNSLCSSSTSTAMVPFKPTSLSATVGSIYTDLTWVDNSSNESGFHIFRKFSDCSTSTFPWESITTLGPDIISYSDLKQPGTYSYKVRSYFRSFAQPFAYGYSSFSNCRSATAQ